MGVVWEMCANERDSDDPFNQTIAENKDWLEAFKRDVGIDKAQGQGQIGQQIDHQIGW